MGDLIENVDPTQTDGVQDPTEPTSDSLPELPGSLITRPANEETQASTTQPEPEPEPQAGFSLADSWPYLALALLLIVFIGYVIHNWRKNKHHTAVEEPMEEPSFDEPEISTTAATPQSQEQLTVAAVTLQGIGAREDQQDSFGLSELTEADYRQQGVLAVVADGMGGLANGKAVSSLLVRTCLNTFKNRRASGDILLEMVTSANLQVNQMLQGKDRSGSTLVAAAIQQGYLNYLTVGDSHIYLYRGGGLILLNREHIYREELALKAANRLVPPQQVTGDPQSKALTSYLGIGKLPHLDRSCESIKLIDGDRVLLCSDGIFGTLSQQQLEQALSLPLQEAADAIDSAIKAAARPYQDNYTAVVLEYRK